MKRCLRSHFSPFPGCFYIGLRWPQPLPGLRAPWFFWCCRSRGCAQRSCAADKKWVMIIASLSETNSGSLFVGVQMLVGTNVSTTVPTASHSPSRLRRAARARCAGFNVTSLFHKEVTKKRNPAVPSEASLLPAVLATNGVFLLCGRIWNPPLRSKAKPRGGVGGGGGRYMNRPYGDIAFP